MRERRGWKLPVLGKPTNKRLARMIMEKYHPPRKKITIVSLGPLLLTLLSLRIALQGVAIAWLPTVFFGVCTGVLLATLLPAASFLLIQNDGFTIRTLFREYTCKWTDVESFSIGYIRKRSLVVFNFTTDYEGHHYSRKLASAMGGYEGVLPETYGFSPEELRDKMNVFREESLNKSASKAMKG